MTHSNSMSEMFPDFHLVSWGRGLILEGSAIYLFIQAPLQHALFLIPRNVLHTNHCLQTVTHWQRLHLMATHWRWVQLQHWQRVHIPLVYTTTVWQPSSTLQPVQHWGSAHKILLTKRSRDQVWGLQRFNNRMFLAKLRGFMQPLVYTTKWGACPQSYKMVARWAYWERVQLHVTHWQPIVVAKWFSTETLLTKRFGNKHVLSGVRSSYHRSKAGQSEPKPLPCSKAT